MRVGVNCFSLQPNMGGLKQYFVNLFDELLEHDSDNQYVFFHFRHNREELAKLNTDCWKQHAILLNTQEEITNHLDGIDVYFSPFGAIWPRPAPVPSVVTLVDVQEFFYPEFFTAADLFSRQWHYIGSTRAADCVVTISEYSKATIVQHHGISPHKVVVAHLCADPRYYQARLNARRPECDLPSGRYLFYPANRWAHKNHDNLLRALQLLKSEKNLKPPVVFSGYDMEGGYPLASKVDEYDLAEQVYTVGYVEMEEIAYLYSEALALVFPSFFEGFGMPPVEAMAAECPVIVSNATCLPEICGDAAEYFDPRSPASIADAILRVWQDSSLCERLIARGRQQARQFSPSRLAQVHLGAFRQAVGSFSTAHYLWHRYAYQPFNHARAVVTYANARRSSNAGKRHECSLVFARGWHPREQDGRNWVRWTSGKGRVVAKTATHVTLKMDGEVVSLQRPNQVHVLVNGREVASWLISGDKFEFQPMAPLLIELSAGESVIEFVSGNRPSRSGGDSRKLAIAVRNLRVSAANPSIRCRLDA